MSPARLHLALGVTDLSAAVVTRDRLVRGLLAALGARHLGQAVLVRRPTRTRLLLSAGVDGLHGVTAVAWALRGPRARELGALSAGVSAAAVLTELPRRTR
jgi:hypothetical protein